MTCSTERTARQPIMATYGLFQVLCQLLLCRLCLREDLARLVELEYFHIADIGLDIDCRPLVFEFLDQDVSAHRGETLKQHPHG